MSVFLLAAEGRIGRLRLGDLLEMITARFGEPDDRLASDPTALIKYGDFELIFADGLLVAVHCEFGAPPLPANPDGTRLGVGTSAIAWPVDLQALTSKATQAGLATEVSETEGSTTAIFGAATLVIDHIEEVAALSVLHQRTEQILSDAERLSKGWTIESVEAMVFSGEDNRLHEAPIAVSLTPPDCEWALGICLSLADHHDARVRANAVLSIGHLARTCPDLPLGEPVANRLAKALDDTDALVRGNAETARQDIMQFRGVVLCESPGGAVWFTEFSGYPRPLTPDEATFLSHLDEPNPWAELVDVRLHSDGPGAPWMLIHHDFIEGGAVRDTLRLDFEPGRIRGGWSPSFLNGDDGVRASNAGIGFGAPDGIELLSTDARILANAARVWFERHVSEWPLSDRRARWGDLSG